MDWDTTVVEVAYLEDESLFGKTIEVRSNDAVCFLQSTAKIFNVAILIVKLETSRFLGRLSAPEIGVACTFWARLSLWKPVRSDLWTLLISRAAEHAHGSHMGFVLHIHVWSYSFAFAYGSIVHLSFLSSDCSSEDYGQEAYPLELLVRALLSPASKNFKPPLRRLKWSVLVKAGETVLNKNLLGSGKNFICTHSSQMSRYKYLACFP